MSLSEDLVVLISGLGLGTYATDLFRDFMPAEPDAVGVVYQTSGSGFDYKFGQKAPGYEWPTAAVHFRGAEQDSDPPRIKAQTALDMIASVALENVNGVYYLSMRTLQSNPVRINRDEDERPVWGFNVMAHRER